MFRRRWVIAVVGRPVVAIGEDHLKRDSHLTYNSTFLEWTTREMFGDLEIEVSCICETAEDFDQYRDSFRTTWLKVTSRDADYRKRAAQELLAIFNSEWNRDDQDELAEPLSSEEFCTRMTPQSVSLMPDGTATIS